MNKVPCSRKDLSAFINAYAIAHGTTNQILMGLAGDALNKLLDTLTFKDDAQSQSVSSQTPTKRTASKKDLNEDAF